MHLSYYNLEMRIVRIVIRNPVSNLVSLEELSSTLVLLFQFGNLALIRGASLWVWISTSSIWASFTSSTQNRGRRTGNHFWGERESRNCKETSLYFRSDDSTETKSFYSFENHIKTIKNKSVARKNLGRGNP